MKCKNCPSFRRRDYQWGKCKVDGIDKESEQSCTVSLLDYERSIEDGDDSRCESAEKLHNA